MPRWIGLLGSWALLVLGLGLMSVAVAGEWINLRDLRRLRRVEMIDRMIAEQTGNRAEILRRTAEQRAADVHALQNRLEGVARQTEDVPDTGQTIIVSTTENKLYVRRDGQSVFEAVCSTGKGTTLVVDGKTMVFDTPTGKFRIKGKEENPVWRPPDWHYVELARKRGMEVIRLHRGSTIDGNSGRVMRKGDEGIWSWFRGSSGSGRTLRVKGNTVVEDYGGYERPLPPATIITAGNVIVIPPVDTVQREFPEVLGRFRLNLGDGYALHGTQETDKLGQAVSHGCVRLADADIEKLYAMTNVGDEVIIY